MASVRECVLRARDTHAVLLEYIPMTESAIQELAAECVEASDLHFLEMREVQLSARASALLLRTVINTPSLNAIRMLSINDNPEVISWSKI